MSKDANELLQDWRKDERPIEEQKAIVTAMLSGATPLVIHVAEQLGKMTEDDRRIGFGRLLDIMRQMDDESREYYIRSIAKKSKSTLADLRGMLKAGDKAEAKGKKEYREPERVTGGWIGGHLLELVFDPVKIDTWFAVRYPDGRVDPYVTEIDIEGNLYAPIWPNSILTKNGVRMPSKIYDKPLTEKELLSITRRHIRKFFDFGNQDFFEELTPQFVMFSYFADAFMETTYLRALGDYGTGKTRFLKAVGMLCYRPIYVTGGSSAASLYHFLDKYKGTLILNEADFGQSDEASIIAKILNGGTERDEGISKMKKTPDGGMEIEMYNVFGPKVIATRKSFDDRAIESRCLTMEMVPMAPRKDIPRNLPADYGDVCTEIRNLWTTYRLFNARERIEIDESNIDFALEARLSQVTAPLMSIISDPDIKEQIKLFMTEYNEREKSSRYATMTARVMEGLMRAWAWGPVSQSPNDEDRIYLKDIAWATNQIIDEMNKTMGDDDEDDESDSHFKKKTGGKTTSRKVSSIMDKFLQLRTHRATDGLPDYKGTMYIDMNRDSLRVQALAERWGIEFLNRSSVQRPVRINLNDPEQVNRTASPNQSTYYTTK